MSDSPEEFRRKARAMFGRVRDFYWELGFRFVVRVSERLVEKTPGFGNQRPTDTPYIPTGQLRGGYSYATAPLGEATVWEGGPTSDYGVETVQRLEAEMRAGGRVSRFYIVNNVAYGHLVHEGRGRHAAVGAREFTKDTANPTTQENAYREALSSMRSV